MNQSQDPNYFRTSDMTLATTLCCHDYLIEAIDKQNPSSVIFVIKRDEQLDNIIQLYFQHRLTVEPLRFSAYLKELKTRIYHT